MISIDKSDCWDLMNLLYVSRFECQILKSKINWFLFSSCIDLANFWSPNMPNKYRHRSFRPGGTFLNQVGTSVSGGHNLIGVGLMYRQKISGDNYPTAPICFAGSGSSTMTWSKFFGRDMSVFIICTLSWKHAPAKVVITCLCHLLIYHSQR